MTFVDELRQMTGVSASSYTINGTAFWTNTQLENVLLAHGRRHFQVPVLADRADDGSVLLAHLSVNGVVSDAGATLVSRSGETLGDWTLDRHGVVTFETDVGDDPPSHFTGWTYDLHAAAVDVLTSWAAAVSLHYDVSADGQNMTRSQKHKQLLAMADWHRSQMLPGTVALRRRRPPRRKTFPGFE